MQKLSLIGITIAFGSLLLGILGIFLIEKLQFENHSLILTPIVKFALISFLFGVLGFIFAVWYESSQSRKELTSRGKKINSDIENMATDIKNISTDLKQQYNEISKDFMIYPAFKKVIKGHFDQLRELHSIGEKYANDDTLQNLFEGYLRFWFNNFIDNDLATCRNHLNNYILISEADFSKSNSNELMHEFLSLSWCSVKKGGKIYATSIVKPLPGGFWQDPHVYLNAQELLIKSKDVKIFRYFIFIEKHDEKLTSHEYTLQLNIEEGIKTRVVLFDGQSDAGDCYQDTGLIDDFMGVVNTIDEHNGIIKKSCCYITNPKNDTKIKSIERVFTNLENHPNTIKFEDHKSFENFTAEVRNKINSLKAKEK